MSGPTVPFQPIGSSVTNTPANGSSSNSALGSTTGFGETLRVANTSGAAIGIRWGTGAQTAVTADPSVANNEVRLFNIPSGVDNVATFGRGAITGTVDIQRGAGGI